MCKCPTIGDLFCGFLNCFTCCESRCCERKPEPSCEHRCEHKEEHCEKRFECVCRERHDEHKEDDKPCEKEHDDSCRCCACRVK